MSLKYKKLMDYLAVKTGETSMSLKNLAQLNDINREIAHNLSQPDWVNHIWPEYGKSTLEIVTRLNEILRNYEFNDETLAFLRGGLLLGMFILEEHLLNIITGDWIQRAQRVAKGNQNRPTKMLLYSSESQ